MMATLFLGIIIGLLLIPGVVGFLLVACDALAEFIAARRNVSQKHDDDEV